MTKRSRDPSMKGLPHNWETERSLLGGLLLAPEVLPNVRELLQPEDFHRPGHQTLYTLICELADRGEPADVEVAVAEVERREIVIQVGGVAYIMGLPAACPTLELVETYAARVRDDSVRRGLVLAARDTEEAVQHGTRTTAELLDEAQAKLLVLASTVGASDAEPLSKLVGDRIAEMHRRARNPGAMVGVPTGFVDLDRKLAGLQPTNLIIVAARPAMGKSGWLLNVACNAARGGTGVGIFSLEMGRGELVDRMLCAWARVDASRVRTGDLSPDDWRRMCEAADQVGALPIAIDDTAGLTIQQLRGKARRMKARFASKGIPLGLLGVDYLQLMQGSEKKGQSRENAVAEISRGLKVLAKELDVPVIALSQLNRSLEARQNKRPLTSDLRESGALEQDADVILFIYRDEVYNEDSPKKGIAEVIVAKQRSGAIGTVELAFLDRYVLFQSLAESGRPSPRGPFTPTVDPDEIPV